MVHLKLLTRCGNYCIFERNSHYLNKRMLRQS